MVVKGHPVHQPVTLPEIEDAAVNSRVVVPQRQRLWLPVPAALKLGPRLVGEKEVQHGPALPVAHAGFDISDDFVVGWGMDYAGRYRNLRGIYRLIIEDTG